MWKMYEREKLKLIIESAAHLVAVMVDKNLGVKRGR